MAQIEITEEYDQAHGWLFEAQMLDEHGHLHHYQITLSYADYNLWSRDGSDPPERVAEAALHYLIEHMGIDDMKPSFDASIARRLEPEADRIIPSLIRA